MENLININFHVGLFCQSIIIFPDKINKIVPIDLRMEGGYIFMVVLTVFNYCYGLV
jgi:hypothetical protein